MGRLDMTKAALAEAQRLGHHWMGPEHGLLAILRGDPDDVARRVLEDAGLTAERFERLYLDQVERGDPKPKPKPRRHLEPGWHTVSGRAEGLASALGTGKVRPVDLLLALLWDTREWMALRQQGIDREPIIAALAREGVALPAVPMPDLDPPWRGSQRVDFPMTALERVIEVVIERHPPGSEWR